MKADAVISLRVAREGESLSVLVLGDDPLKYRRCEGDHAYDLKDWFLCVEMNAWKRVEYHERPKEIFLVIGQHLTPAYAISHKVHGSSECEVMVKAQLAAPSIVSGGILGNFAITEAYASTGFEHVVTKSSTTDPIQYTIFLHTYKSGPIQRFRKSNKEKVEEQYRSNTHTLFRLLIYSFFQAKAAFWKKGIIQNAGFRYVEGIGSNHITETNVYPK